MALINWLLKLKMHANTYFFEFCFVWKYDMKIFILLRDLAVYIKTRPFFFLFGPRSAQKKLGRGQPKRAGPTSTQNKGWAYIGPTYLLFFLWDWAEPDLVILVLAGTGLA
jgi:hypothetical protein